MVLDKANSDMALSSLVVLLACPGAMVLLFLALGEKWKWILDYVTVPVLLGTLSFQCLNWFYWPRHIRFFYSNPPGASGSFHVVEFQHLVKGEWIDGPSVMRYPMRVAFPDINGDGFRDIRVVESSEKQGKAIEFVFVPNAEDKIYWVLNRSDASLSATYEAGGVFQHWP